MSQFIINYLLVKFTQAVNKIAGNCCRKKLNIFLIKLNFFIIQCSYANVFAQSGRGSIVAEQADGCKWFIDSRKSIKSSF